MPSRAELVVDFRVVNQAFLTLAYGFECVPFGTLFTPHDSRQTLASLAIKDGQILECFR